jgi:hypothetical protein
MARARNIKPALFKNEILGVADPLLTILFENLWCLADREGRMEDRPLRIKAETFPYREGLDVNGYLTELEHMGFIERYLVDGAALIQIINFKKHQTPHNTEKPSELPAPNTASHCACGLPGITVKPPLSPGEITAALPPDSLNPLTDSFNPCTDSLNPDNGLLKPDLASTAKAPAEQKKSNTKGNRLPKDWVLPITWGKWAMSDQPTWTQEYTRRVGDMFKDYWIAAAGGKGSKLDWEATWRNWVRNQGTLKGALAASGLGAAGQQTAASMKEFLADFKRPEGTA